MNNKLILLELLKKLMDDQRILNKALHESIKNLEDKEENLLLLYEQSVESGIELIHQISRAIRIKDMELKKELAAQKKLQTKTPLLHPYQGKNKPVHFNLN